MADLMTPEEFKQAVSEIYGEDPEWDYYDEEATHLLSDKLMEKVLDSLGYEEGIALIRKSRRWYA